MNYKIAVIPGDGIGPEIIEQALKSLKTTADKFGHTFELTEARPSTPVEKHFLRNRSTCAKPVMPCCSAR